jgi:hypothetical protein
MSGRVATSAPSFITLLGEHGPITLALHNIIRYAPCRSDPVRKTVCWSRGHQGTTTILAMPHSEVAARIEAKLGGGQ